MTFVEELDEFLVDFAVTALHNGSTSVKGIFQNEYLAVAGELADTESSSPRFGCKAASLPDVKQGDTLQIDGVTYDVANVQPDGTGWLHLAIVKQ